MISINYVEYNTYFQLISKPIDSILGN